MLVYDYNYFCKIYGNMYDSVLQKTFPFSVSTSPSGHLLHKMSVWHININCSVKHVANIIHCIE